MKRVASALLTCGLVLCANIVLAQSADSIISRHMKAIGGKKALETISSVRMTGRVTRSAANDQAGQFLWQAKTPGATYLELRWEDAHLIEACNGRSAWKDVGSGPQTLSGREQARARTAAHYRNDRFLTYRKEKTRVQLLGRENVAGRPAFAVEMTTRSGQKRKLFFDAENYLLLKEAEEREGGREEIVFSDYRAVDGVKEPFRIQIRHGAESFDLVVQQVTHNAGVDDRAFDFPARAERPLPDLAALLRAVVDNQEQIRKVREDYTYTATESEFEIDDKGRIKQKSEEVYEVYFFYGGQVKKLVQKDGRPLSENEKRKEEARVEKLIREREKHHREAEARRQRMQQKAPSPKAAPAAKQSEPPAKRAQAKDSGDDNFSIEDFLRISRVTNPRRERFRGKDVIVFEFEPDPAYKPKNRIESWVQKMAGMFWVEEEAKQIVRLEARLLDTIRLLGGFAASVGKGTEVVFEQELVNNEVWLPRYMEGHVSARLLLVKGFKVHRIERYSDYKKFNVETRMEVKPPAETKPPDT